MLQSRRASPGRRPTCCARPDSTPITLATERRAHADQRHAGAHGDRRARARRRASPLAHRARRRRDVARSADGHAGRVRSRAFRTCAASSGRRRRPRCCASCSPTARFASRIATNDPRVQDAYALRCMPQVHGPVLDALDFAVGGHRPRAQRRDRQSARLRDGRAAERRKLSRPVGCDGARLPRDRADESRDDLRAAHRSARASGSESRDCRRSSRSDAGVNSGFMMAQVTAASLASECKVLSHPASVDTIPTDGSKEDVVPMAMAAAWKLRRIVRNVRYVLAIELMCARAGHRLPRAAQAGPRRRARARARCADGRAARARSRAVARHRAPRARDRTTTRSTSTDSMVS